MFLFFEKKKNAGLETRAPKKVDALADAFATIRPDQALGGQTPAEWLANLTAEEAPASQRS